MRGKDKEVGSSVCLAGAIFIYLFILKKNVVKRSN